MNFINRCIFTSMSEPLVRVYSEQTKKVKYVTPAQVVLLKGLGYEPQAEPERLEPIVLQESPKNESEATEIIEATAKWTTKPEMPQAEKPKTEVKVKPKTTKKNAA